MEEYLQVATFGRALATEQEIQPATPQGQRQIRQRVEAGLP
jgi:hypothetical protein